MYGRTRRAFTLIELLVVIAIIAILAAILFPVFAQARQAARGASSQSNIKQLSLGILMYVQDYDESYPQFQSWPGPGAPVCWGSCTSGGWSMWTFDTAPYLKNAQIFADPLYGGSGSSAFTLSIYPDYGYNYTTLSPYKGGFGTTPWIWAGENLAAINAPAGTVLLSAKFDTKEIGATYYYGLGTMFNEGNAEAPDCSDIPSWCWTDWAPNGNDSVLKTEFAGVYTGGNTPRKQGNLNFSFCDGHAKFLQEGQGAAGTTWYKGIGAGNVHITDSTKYLWQVN